MSRDDVQPKLFPGSLRNHLKSKGRSRRQEMNRLGQASVKRSGMRNDHLPGLHLVHMPIDDLRMPARAVRKLDPAHINEVAGSIDFYTKHLGFELVEQMGPAFALIAKGDLNIWLSGPGSSAARPMPDGRKPEAGGWNRFVIEVQDIEAVVASMKTAGVLFRNDLVTGPGGVQIVAEDPSGNPIEIFQPA